MNHFHQFKELHQQDDMLHIGNVWDRQSALIFEKMGYKALGTSSAAIADTLGYEDGEKMSFDALLHVTQNIINSISIPLTVDLEAGYHRDTKHIVQYITHLAKIGVAGINLEDSVVDNHGNRCIVDATEFACTLTYIKNYLTTHNINIFLNIRTDAFILNLDKPVEKSILRAKRYKGSGADGLFVPGISHAKDIKKVVNSGALPVNVMAMPELPAFSILKKLGVKRVSAGPFVYHKMKKILATQLEYIKEKQSFQPLF